MDAATRAKIETVKSLGDQTFDENTRILKKMMLRGLRAFAVVGVGLFAFNIAMKRKKAQRMLEEAAAAESAGDSDDPTLRYLAEMRSIGFDVDGLEEEIAARDKARSDP
jgi:hypothetical protein